MCVLEIINQIKIKVGFDFNWAPKTDCGSAVKKAKAATSQTGIIDKLDQGHSILY